MFLQQAEARETRRHYEHSCKVHTHIVSRRSCLLVDVWFVFFQILNLSFVCFVQTLEELTESYRTHSTDLAKNVSQYSHTQQEVRQIRYMCEQVHVCMCVFGVLSVIFL